ncbi:hypothetical protein [Actinoplanes derwentensis]|uniref:Uncharacterized protein n=1 Tax=Actinoplanes derwentensis TaxID=113562 RepID=A0A1H1YFU9_9ACTN|nr:hypothetical protein [Actinoplanes derwentensis]GID81131.1 hypothetical protein Ade03nite_00550 [Actinoplanes derwentensis]SDT20398.1 hypothetical protein SAMN04489716_2840 [Actinoplanes derwentensis]
MTLRTTVILTISLVAGSVVGGLTYVSGENVPKSLLAGLATVPAGVAFLHSIIQAGAARGGEGEA